MPKSFGFLAARFRFLNARLGFRHRSYRLCFRGSIVSFAFFSSAGFTQRDSSTGLLDFFACSRTDSVDLHFKVVLYLAITENFDPGKMTTDEIRFAQKLFVYDGAGFKCTKVAQVHNSVMLMKRRIIKSALRQSPNQRHLSAFEAEPDTSTRARFLAFVPLPAGFPVS